MHQNTQTLLFAINKKINRMLNSDWFYHREKYLNPVISKLTELKKQIIQKHFLDSSFQKIDRLNSFKLHFLRKTKKTQQLISTIDGCYTSSDTSFASFKKSPNLNQIDVQISNESTPEQILKKKILDNIKLLTKLFEEYEIISRQLDHIPLKKLDPQNETEMQLLQLSLIDLWNHHLEKIHIIQNKASQNDNIYTNRIKRFVEENEELQLRHNLQKYKFWQASCLKTTSVLIREMKKLCVSDQQNSFSKSSEFESSLGKKSLLTQKLRLQKSIVNKENYNSQIKLLESNIREKSKKKKYISEREMSFDFDSKIKRQIRPKTVKPCVQCNIF